MSDSLQNFLSRLKKAITSYYTGIYSSDTELDNILRMYSTEFASGSREIETTYNNLFILNANITKLYDNFGTYFSQPRVFSQDIDEDIYTSSSGSIPAYRKTVDFLMDASLHGGSIHAIKRVVNAFTLTNPDIRELYNAPRWKLKAYSGSIAATSGNIITVSPDPGWRRNEFLGSIATLYSGSLNVPPQDGGKIYSLYIVTENTQCTLTLGAIS
jgi:hypothetical protein